MAGYAGMNYMSTARQYAGRYSFTYQKPDSYSKHSFDLIFHEAVASLPRTAGNGQSPVPEGI